MASPHVWAEDEIHHLIDEYKRRPILWVLASESVDKFKKLSAWRELANIFNTTVAEVQRKTNYLKNQFNEETKKMRKMKVGKRKSYIPWIYYEDLQFLSNPDGDASFLTQAISESPRKRGSFACRIPEPELKEQKSGKASRLSPETGRSIKRKKISNTEESADEEIEPRPTPIKGRKSLRGREELPSSVLTPKRRRLFHEQQPGRVSVTHTFLKPGRDTSPVTYKTVSYEKDDDSASEVSMPSQVESENYEMFGSFVASELRNLKHEHNRVRLKGMIQRCIMQVSEEDSITPTNRKF